MGKMVRLAFDVDVLDRTSPYNACLELNSLVVESSKRVHCLHAGDTVES